MKCHLLQLAKVREKADNANVCMCKVSGLCCKQSGMICLKPTLYCSEMQAIP